MYMKVATHLIDEAKSARQNIRAQMWREYFAFKENCLLLVNILDFWAKMNQIEDYPKDMEPVSESVVRIKSYFKIS